MRMTRITVEIVERASRPEPARRRCSEWPQSPICPNPRLPATPQNRKCRHLGSRSLKCRHLESRSPKRRAPRSSAHSFSSRSFNSRRHRKSSDRRFSDLSHKLKRRKLACRRFHNQAFNILSQHRGWMLPSQRPTKHSPLQRASYSLPRHSLIFLSRSRWRLNQLHQICQVSVRTRLCMTPAHQHSAQALTHSAARKGAR